MARSKQAQQIMQMSVSEWENTFPDEEACDRYLVAHRWPDGVYCPRCGSTRVYELKTRPWHWECPDCRQGGAYRFSDITGTVFENTNKPLRDWFRVLHLILTSKKGISARQIHRYMGFGSLKTAWYMAHRLRAAMADKEFQKLMGVVEVDETYIGGRGKNKHKRDKDDGPKGGVSGKVGVAAAVQRKGNVVARVIEKADQATLETFVYQTVSDKVSLLATDDYPAYHWLKETYPHESVVHSKHQYVHGVVHTNTIEGFFSILKRGIIGTYHQVSRKYMPLYIAEFQFRYNNRTNENIFETAIAGC
jgi:transposase-like protein/IS1 family transposase